MYAYDDDDVTAGPGDPALREPTGRRTLGPPDWIALIALVAGGVNCGLIAAVNLDVFARVLPSAIAARVAYGLVGLAALHCIVLLFRLGAEND